MEEEKMVEEQSSETGETLEATEQVETPETQPGVDVEELKKKAELAENYRIRAEKAEKALKHKPQEISKEGVDSIDLIKLGKKLQDYSDDELDFVTEFAKSKKPEDVLRALENPFVQKGISAYREQLEKERLSLKPSSTQSESEQPKSLIERLKTASLAEKEKLLKEAGLYKEYRPRADRVNIGPKLSL